MLPVLFAVLLSSQLTGCRNEEPDMSLLQLSAPSDRDVEEEIPLYTVERGTVTRKVQFLSSIAPIDKQKLYFRSDGRIRVINVKEDDWVSAGAVLAELEMTDLLNRIGEAEVNLEMMRQRLAKITANTEATARAEVELKIREIELEKARAEDPDEEIVIAGVNLQKAEIALEQARTFRISPLKEAELNYRIAEATYQQAQESRELYLLQLQMLNQQVELARINLRAAREYDDYQAAADVKLAELAAKRLRDQAEMNRIRSPIDGRVMSISKVAGSEVNAYSPVVIVADPSTLEVVADLMRSEVIQLHEGQEAEIELADYPGNVIKGYIRRLPYVGLTGMDYVETLDRSTRIRFNPPRSTNLKVGDLARATIVLEKRDNVLYLPPEAIRVFQGRRFVVVQESDRRRRVDVKIGLESDDRVEIKEGLQEGMTVIGQ